VVSLWEEAFPTSPSTLSRTRSIDASCGVHPELFLVAVVDACSWARCWLVEASRGWWYRLAVQH